MVQHLHVEPTAEATALATVFWDVVETSDRGNRCTCARISFTTSDQRPWNSSLPILKARRQARLVAQAAMARSAVGTSRATMMGFDPAN